MFAKIDACERFIANPKVPQDKKSQMNALYSSLQTIDAEYDKKRGELVIAMQQLINEQDLKVMEDQKKNESPSITKEQFLSFERVRKSGLTNMFDVKTVMSLSHLDRKTILDIMEQYDQLSELYLKK